MTEWLNILGYDIRSMAPDVSYTGDLNPSPPLATHHLLPASSAFECTFRRDMENLLTISTVPRSKVRNISKSMITCNRAIISRKV